MFRSIQWWLAWAVVAGAAAGDARALRGHGRLAQKIVFPSKHLLLAFSATRTARAGTRIDAENDVAIATLHSQLFILHSYFSTYCLGHY